MSGEASDETRPDGVRSDEQVAPTAEETAPPVRELRIEDDGSVPDKQIQRWKNEGGA